MRVAENCPTGKTPGFPSTAHHLKTARRADAGGFRSTARRLSTVIRRGNGRCAHGRQRRRGTAGGHRAYPQIGVVRGAELRAAGARVLRAVLLRPVAAHVSPGPPGVRAGRPRSGAGDRVSPARWDSWGGRAGERRVSGARAPAGLEVLASAPSTFVLLLLAMIPAQLVVQYCSAISQQAE